MMISTPRPAADAHTSPDCTHPRLVLWICSFSLLLIGLDVTIVNVALPAIGRSFHASLSGLQWVVDAYTLVLAGLLIAAGAAADRFGRRRVFQSGLGLFALGSVLCAAAPSLPVLIGARAVQAVGGAMLSPATMSIVRNVFEDPRERARAIGTYAAMFGVSMGLGPVLGGLLVNAVSWRAIFVITVPCAVVAIAASARGGPEARPDRARPSDPVGQALVLAAPATLAYAIIDGGRVGFGAPGTLILMGAAALALIALVTYELGRAEPLVDMRLFRSAPFAGAIAIAVCLVGALGGFLFMSTFYLQDARHLPAWHAGLYLLPMAAAISAFAPVSGRLTARLGARIPMTLGGVAVLAGGLMLTRLTPGTATLWLIATYATFGLGFGLASPPIASTAVSGMPAAQAGVAAAIATTGRQIGIALGVAVCGALVDVDPHAASAVGLARATHAGWWLIAGLGLAVAVIGCLTAGGASRQVSMVRRRPGARRRARCAAPGPRR
jgi:EmrB/QacA subfamily drug resistance transporter